MDSPSSTPQDTDEVTPLQLAAIALHEMFLAFQSAGFTEDQALTLVSAKFAPRGTNG